MVEEECYYVESVGGVDENTPSTSFPHMLLAALVHMNRFLPLFMCHLHPFQMLKVCICDFPTF
jgi:hypothetical protein